RLLDPYERRVGTGAAPQKTLLAAIQEYGTRSILANGPGARAPVRQHYPPARKTRRPWELVHVLVAADRLTSLQCLSRRSFVQQEPAAFSGILSGRSRAILGDA